MGLFSKKPAEVLSAEERAERERQAAERVRVALRDLAIKNNESNTKQARRAGVPADGSIYVMFSIISMVNRCVVIREGQIDYYQWSSFSDFTPSRDQHVTLPIPDVTDLREVQKNDLHSELTVTGTTGGFTIRTLKGDISYAIEVIEGLRQAAAERTQAERRTVAADGGPGQLDPKAALSKLQELHEASLLTDDEYQTKRAEIIGRL